MKKPRQTQWDRGFMDGVLSCLTIVHSYGDDHVYDEIVRGIGRDHLVSYALGDKVALDSSGLVEHGYITSGEGLEL